MGQRCPLLTNVSWTSVPHQGQDRLHQQTQHPPRTAFPCSVHQLPILGAPLQGGLRNPTTNKNKHSNDEGKGNEKTNTTQNADKNKNNNGGKSNSGNANTGSSNTNQKKPNPNLSSKLGKDGKLTQAERQSHFEQNLCLFCGKTGHIAKECSKATSTAAKAHSTSATDKSSDTKSGMESKNL